MSTDLETIHLTLFALLCNCKFQSSFGLQSMVYGSTVRDISNTLCELSITHRAFHAEIPIIVHFINSCQAVYKMLLSHLDVASSDLIKCIVAGSCFKSSSYDAISLYEAFYCIINHHYAHPTTITISNGFSCVLIF